MHNFVSRGDARLTGEAVDVNAAASATNLKNPLPHCQMSVSTFDLRVFVF